MAENKPTLLSDIDLAVEFTLLAEGEATLFRREVLGQLNEKFDVQVYNQLPAKVKKEIDEFTQLEKWIAKLQKVTKKIPGKKNDALIKDLQSIHEYIESAYSLFAQKKTAREAVQYLISSYSQLIESSAALSAKISSTFSFFKTSTFKEKFDSIFREMEKQYPTIVIVGLNNASSVN